MCIPQGRAVDPLPGALVTASLVWRPEAICQCDGGSGFPGVALWVLHDLVICGFKLIYI